MKPTDDLSESVGLSIAALVLASVIPMAATGPFAELPYGLFVLVAGYAGVALTLAVTGTAGDDWMAAAGRLRAAVVWSGCGVAMMLAIAAVVVTAQTMDLRNVVLAHGEHAALSAAATGRRARVRTRAGGRGESRRAPAHGGRPQRAPPR